MFTFDPREGERTTAFATTPSMKRRPCNRECPPAASIQTDCSSTTSRLSPVAKSSALVTMSTFTMERSSRETLSTACVSRTAELGSGRKPGHSRISHAEEQEEEEVNLRYLLPLLCLCVALTGGCQTPSGQNSPLMDELDVLGSTDEIPFVDKAPEPSPMPIREASTAISFPILSLPIIRETNIVSIQIWSRIAWL